MACHADHGRRGVAGRLALRVAWGLHDHAYALIGLQFCLAAINLRGVYKNE